LRKKKRDKASCAPKQEILKMLQQEDTYLAYLKKKLTNTLHAIKSAENIKKFLEADVDATMKAIEKQEAKGKERLEVDD
jgi:hypothetical protein